MIKKFKYFLAIYIPTFVVTGVLLRNSAALKPVAYIFTAICLLAIGFFFFTRNKK